MENVKISFTRRPSKDQYYLDIALSVSKRSNCLKRKYGVVVVNNDEIIATGYNGSPRGEQDCCVLGICKRMNVKHNSGDYDKCHSVHAEQNALISAARRDMIGATLYLAGEEYVPDDEKADAWDNDWQLIKNAEPCPICARMIKNSGIKRVVNNEGDVELELCL